MRNTNNPLYNMYGKQPQSQNNGNDMISKFNQFKANFTGDPKAKVQELLNSGQMTQEQFNMLSSMAQSFMNNQK